MVSALPERTERLDHALLDLALRELQGANHDDDQHQQHAAHGNGPALALRHRHACLLVTAWRAAWQ